MATLSWINAGPWHEQVLLLSFVEQFHYRELQCNIWTLHHNLYTLSQLPTLDLFARHGNVICSMNIWLIVLADGAPNYGHML